MKHNRTYETWLERFISGEAKLEWDAGHTILHYAGEAFPLASYEAEEQMAIFAAEEGSLHSDRE